MNSKRYLFKKFKNFVKKIDILTIFAKKYLLTHSFLFSKLSYHFFNF